VRGGGEALAANAVSDMLAEEGVVAAKMLRDEIDKLRRLNEVCVYECVCMSVRIYVNMYVWAYTHTHAYTQRTLQELQKQVTSLICTCMWADIYIHTHIHTNDVTGAPKASHKPYRRRRKRQNRARSLLFACDFTRAQARRIRESTRRPQIAAHFAAKRPQEPGRRAEYCART
jgi:hypothetical protein